MKTTIDLPDDLVRKLKIRAAREGRKMKDVAAEYLRKGLAAQASVKHEARPVIVKDKKTGLPVIQGRGTPKGDLTPERVAQILIDQEVAWALGDQGDST